MTTSCHTCLLISSLPARFCEFMLRMFEVSIALMISGSRLTSNTTGIYLKLLIRIISVLSDARMAFYDSTLSETRLSLLENVLLFSLSFI